MTTIERDNEIERLTRAGLSARLVRERLRLTISTRRVQRIAAKRVGHSPKHIRSIENQLANLRPLVLACMVEIGKDPYFCEVCELPQTKHCEIHHTKYEGATLYDLAFVCRGCNQARAAKGLL